MEKVSEFWADIATIAALPVAIAVGCAKGAVDAVTGNGAFDDGFNAATVSVLEPARKFGKEHGKIITKGLLTGAASALGGRIVNDVMRRLNI
jgi:hypothetical protein